MQSGMRWFVNFITRLDEKGSPGVPLHKSFSLNAVLGRIIQHVNKAH